MGSDDLIGNKFLKLFSVNQPLYCDSDLPLLLWKDDKRGWKYFSNSIMKGYSDLFI